MMFKITYTYRADGRVFEGDVLVMGTDKSAVKKAFYTTHATSAGEHKITNIELFSTVELDTLL